MKKEIGFRQLLLAFMMIGLFFTSSIAVPIDAQAISMAYSVTRLNYPETYKAIKESASVENALVTIKLAEINTFDEGEVYELLSLTYGGNNWSEPVNEHVAYELRKYIAKNAKWFGVFYEEPPTTLLDTQMRYSLDVIWPPDDGFGGKKTATILKVGTIVDRYGYPGGKFLSPVGVEYNKRALPPGTKETKPYFKYEVLKEITVLSGPIKEWFGSETGGTQYWLQTVTVNKCIEDGYLKMID